MILPNYNSNGFWFLVAMVVCGAIPGAAQDQPTQEQPAKISHLIQQLDSSSYTERNSASKQLVQFGKPAIGALFLAMSSSDFETSFRAMRIVKQVGLNGDLDTLESIIRSSGELPEVLKKQFDLWSLEAIDHWRANQGRKAARLLTVGGATVSKINDLSELGILLIDDADFQVEKARTQNANNKSVLEQIADLKKELSGEVVPGNKSATPNNDLRLQNREQVEIGGAIRFGERGVIPLPRGRNAILNATNVSFDGNWNGQVKDLLHLRFVTNLNEIEFVELKITPDILGYLKRIRKLRSVKLTRCQYSFSQLRDFKTEKEKEYPLRLMAIGVGYLGVYGPNLNDPNDGQGSYVSMVSPNSAASEAGLERGDTILKVDGERIFSFAELSLVVSSKPVGKAIEIAIKRDQKEKVLKATLKSRVGLR